MDKRSFDIAVIGGGAAGSMAAIRAAEFGKGVALVERNESIGRKLLLTGKGRCNLTNNAEIDAFIGKFGKQGQFLRSAFFIFSNEDLIAFFRSAGLETKVERQARVFPSDDSARSVVEALRRRIKELGVEVLSGSRVNDIRRSADGFALGIEGRGGGGLSAARAILSTGGASYKETGSTGDGYAIAGKLGHDVIERTPGLVPLTTKEAWVKDLQGLGLENVRITVEHGKHRITSDVGELMFTHFGVSGPLVLDLSAEILAMMRSGKGAADETRLRIDLKPGMAAAQIEKRLLDAFKRKGKTRFRNIMKDFLPQRLIDVFIELTGIKADKELCQVAQKERKSVVALFKGLPLTVSGSLPLEEGMVTCGGVSTREIDPSTMRSRIVPGLYFAGEIIDGRAPSGGYNLQQAFSTGYLAGDSAAKSLQAADVDIVNLR